MSAKKAKAERRSVTRIEAIRPMPVPPKRWPLVAIRVLAALGLGITIYLSVLHYQAGSGGTIESPFCGVGPVINCNAVLGSSYGRLFGIPIAFWAAVTYATTLVVSFRSQPGLLTLLCGWIFVFSLYMAGLSLFAIRAACLFCMSLYAINTGLLISAVVLARSSAVFTLQQAIYTLAGCGVLVAGLGWWQAQAAGGLTPLKNGDEAEFIRRYNERPLVILNAAERHAEGPLQASITISEFVDFR